MKNWNAFFLLIKTISVKESAYLGSNMDKCKKKVCHLCILREKMCFSFIYSKLRLRSITYLVFHWKWEIFDRFQDIPGDLRWCQLPIAHDAAFEGNRYHRLEFEAVRLAMCQWLQSVCIKRFFSSFFNMNFIGVEIALKMNLPLLLLPKLLAIRAVESSASKIRHWNRFQLLVLTPPIDPHCMFKSSNHIKRCGCEFTYMKF